MDNIFKIFDEVEEELKFIASSGVRAKMMISLLEKSKTSTELKSELKLGASTIIHAARDLEKEKILKEEADGYHLTTVGKIITYKLIEMVKTLKALKKSQEFWLTHIVDDVPEKFLREMYKLYEHNTLRSSMKNVFKTLSIYLELSRKAKKFWVFRQFLLMFLSL